MSEDPFDKLGSKALATEQARLARFFQTINEHRTPHRTLTPKKCVSPSSDSAKHFQGSGLREFVTNSKYNKTMKMCVCDIRSD